MPFKKFCHIENWYHWSFFHLKMGLEIRGLALCLQFSQNWLGQPISILPLLERGESWLSNVVWPVDGTFFSHNTSGDNRWHRLLCYFGFSSVPCVLFWGGRKYLWHLGDKQNITGMHTYVYCIQKYKDLTQRTLNFCVQEKPAITRKYLLGKKFPEVLQFFTLWPENEHGSLDRELNVTRQNDLTSYSVGMHGSQSWPLPAQTSPKYLWSMFPKSGGGKCGSNLTWWYRVQNLEVAFWNRFGQRRPHCSAEWLPPSQRPATFCSSVNAERTNHARLVFVCEKGTYFIRAE